ncbi:MAG: hypothetical protein A2Y74_06145 [Actinobacteria bacterium RBG_13_63_9]|nr:MAG: hypothetical protein A2Y74_06145 [Actinobacteria bacterium RBG_13_63_9]
MLPDKGQVGAIVGPQGGRHLDCPHGLEGSIKVHVGLGGRQEIGILELDNWIVGPSWKLQQAELQSRGIVLRVRVRDVGDRFAGRGYGEGYQGRLDEDGIARAIRIEGNE